MKQFRHFLEEEVFGFLPEGGVKAEVAQIVSDFAIGLDVTGILSERMTQQYMFDNMGGLDGNDGLTLDYFRGAEAYNVVFSKEEDANLVVMDRSAHFDPGTTWETYNRSEQQKEDTKCLTRAMQEWFGKLFVASRLPGADDSLVRTVMVNTIGVPLSGVFLKYGILHQHLVFAPLYTHRGGGNMYLEFWAAGNTRSEHTAVLAGERPTFPYFHPWKHEKVEFRIQNMTYSNRRILSVHMPGYG